MIPEPFRWVLAVFYVWGLFSIISVARKDPSLSSNSRKIRVLGGGFLAAVMLAGMLLQLLGITN
jgi:hypothetical protein